MFVSSKKAQEFYDVSPETLRQWAIRGEIEFITTNGGHRRYKVICSNNNENERKSYIYARVSSKKQEDDLKHQVSFIKEKYPDYEVLTDIGSGINPNRKNFKTLLDRILNGTVKEVVVAHKDRLSGFSFDIIQLICRKFGTKLIVINDKENREPAEELTDDLMSVITVFSARYYGSRKY